MTQPIEQLAILTYLVLADCFFAIEATIEAVSVNETRTIFINSLKKIMLGYFSLIHYPRCRNSVEPGSPE